MSRSRVALVHVAAPLALGALSYLVMRSWVPLLGAHVPLWRNPPALLRDHFADAAWGWALGGLVSVMWRDETRLVRAAWVLVAAMLAASLELLQTPVGLGSFDRGDLVAQVGAVLAAALTIRFGHPGLKLGKSAFGGLSWMVQAFGLLAFAALGVGSMRHRASMSGDAGSTVTTTTATTTASTAAAVDPTDAPDPTADYTTIDQAKLDGNKALGKTLFFRVWRGTTDASSVLLYGCGKLAGGYLSATYTLEQRPLVKAIPSTIPSQGRCPRVVVKLKGKEAYSNNFKAEIVQILDLTPAEVEPLPAGVDYVSMDDVNIDGKKAAGKVVQLRAYRSDLEEKKLTLYPCGRSGGAGLNFLYVTFTPAQKEAVKDFSSSIMSCETIKVKLTTQQAYSSTWNAQMLDVVKE